MKEMITYRKFNDPELAKSYLAILADQKIEALVTEQNQFFDPSFANNRSDFNTFLKLRGEDFEKADQIFENYFQQQVDEVAPDYYLFSFTDQELKDLIDKRDEWGHLDFFIAKKILKTRGIEISQEQIKSSTAERLKELAVPEEINSFWIILGYALSIFLPIIYFTWGFINVLVAWIITFLKKTLPNGERVYVYGITTRKHGKNIWIISIVLTSLSWILSICGYIPIAQFFKLFY